MVVFLVEGVVVFLVEGVAVGRRGRVYDCFAAFDLIQMNQMPWCRRKQQRYIQGTRTK